MTDSPEDDARARCLRCLRPFAMCWCGDLPTVPTRTRIVILQHPHERTHPFGTVRLAKLCMPDASVHVPWAGFTGTLSLPVAVPDDAAVLYPHRDAIDLETLPVAERPSALIAIDGTWAHAKRLYRENTWLHGRRHVRLSPAAPSRYRIRREPRPDYVSTLEAIVEALRILEPETPGLEDLLLAFDRMIDRQVAHTSSNPRVVRRRVRREKASRALSPLLHDPRLILAYAEATMPAEERGSDRELVQWAAVRVADGACFDAVLRPVATWPDEGHLAHMELDRSLLEGGEALAAAAARFALFAGPGAPVTAWTGSTLVWGHAMLPPGTEHTLLKQNYCNVAQRRSGRLDEAVQRESLTAPPLPLRGRAADRLAFALAITRWLIASTGPATPHPG